MSDLQSHIMESAQLALIKTDELTPYVERTARGLYLGLKGRVSRLLVDTADFAEAL